MPARLHGAAQHSQRRRIQITLGQRKDFALFHGDMRTRQRHEGLHREVGWRAAGNDLQRGLQLNPQPIQFVVLDHQVFQRPMLNGRKTRMGAQHRKQIALFIFVMQWCPHLEIAQNTRHCQLRILTRTVLLQMRHQPLQRIAMAEDMFMAGA